jgi:hypothetical protein
VVTDTRIFRRLCSEWDALLDESTHRVFFLRWKWNFLWWQHYAPEGSRLHLIVCRDPQRRLVGLAPFYLSTRRILGIADFRELRFLGMGIDLKTSEHLDILVRRGCEAAVAAAVALCLRANQEWDRLWLWQIPMESTMLAHLRRALGSDSRVRVCDQAPFIDTSTDWATFKAGFGRSMRRNVDYYPRRLMKRYPSTKFARVRDAADLEPAMDALVELHQRRWHAQGEPGALGPALANFLREVMRDAFANSRLALWTLKIDGVIEAALVGFVDNGKLHYFQKGFNPAYRDEDLGTAMLAMCVRDCFDDPQIREFDFMGGGARYKSLWARASRANVVLEVQRPTVGSALFSFTNRVVACMTSVYRQVVPDSVRVARREFLRRRRLYASLQMPPIVTMMAEYFTAL